MRVSSPLLVVLAALGLSACTGSFGPSGYVFFDEARVAPEPNVDGLTEKAQAKVEWSADDAPSLVDANLEYLLEALPESGEAHNIPWPGAYWPTWQDSINNRWAGPNSQSPAAKYGEAFGAEDVEDRVSEHYGIDRHAWRTPCNSNNDCGVGEGSCAIRSGADAGYCIPTWWGICHAWAPAAILEAEPIHPVTHAGVTFEVNDIKALVTLGYDRSFARGVSLRCNQDGSGDEIEYDAYGRPTDSECIDTNPGTFHVILTNLLGIRGDSFVEDRTWDDEVWNQPLRGYSVLKMEEITAQHANQLVGVTEGGESTMSFGASLAAQAWHHEPELEVWPGQGIEIEMRGDGDADLYVRFDAKPTLSDYNCRPFASHSNESCQLVAPQVPSRLFVSVRGYTGTSNVEVSVTVREPLDGDSYQFNALAEQLFRVRTQVEYLLEPDVTIDGNLAEEIDLFTGRDIYEYILEVDAAGQVIGGEWLGNSRQNHPDFLWLPESRNPYETIAGGAIKWNRIEELLAASVAPEGEDTGGAIVTHSESGSLDAQEWAHFGPFEAGDGLFSAVMTGTGDADLYLRRGAAPTTIDFDCRPYRSDSNEQCEVAGPGSFWVGVRGYQAASFELDLSFIAPGGESGNETPSMAGDAGADEPTQLDENGSLERGEWARYSLQVSAGQRVVVRTTADNDVDLYLKMAAAPTSVLYDVRAFTVSGDETIDFIAPATETLHIGVNGWEAAEFTMWTADE